MTLFTENIRIVSPEEYDKINGVIERHAGEFPTWFPLAIRTYGATGARPAEIVGKNARVDPGPLKNPGVKFRQYGTQLHHGLRGRDVLGGSMLFVEGKNTMGGFAKATALKPREIICANTPTYKELKELSEIRSPDEHLFGLGPNPRPYMDGYWQLTKYVRRLRKFLPGNLEAFEVRWLRHSWAVNALRAGVDLVSVQRQLGHTDLETTAIYLRFAPPDREKVVAAFTPAPKVEAHAYVKHDCPSCGFVATRDQAGRLVLDDRMGVVMRRRVFG